MKTIKISSGKEVIVDDELFELLNQYHWYYDGRYACRSKWNPETKRETKIYMHKQIIGMRIKTGMFVDHINNDKLDNRMCNLRLVTCQQNNMNQTVQKKNKYSKYKGVSWDKSRNKWIAYCKKDGKMYNLGRFDSELEAAVSYNMKVLELFGEHARLNDLPPTST